jgi:glucitol operon activator protein
MWMKVLLIIGAAWVCQGILVYFQIKNFQKKLAELKEHGRLGIGTVKGRFGSGVIVILGVNDEDIITNAQIMTGITVFARFVSFEAPQNQNIKDVDIITKSMNKKTKTAVLKAIDSLDQ